jgi:hypothetical protein
MALLEKKRDYMVSGSIFVETTGKLTQKRDDPVKTGRLVTLVYTQQSKHLTRS